VIMGTVSRVLPRVVDDCHHLLGQEHIVAAARRACYYYFFKCTSYTGI